MKLLTVDENGNDATSPTSIPRRSSSTGSRRSATTCVGLGAYWGAGSLVGDDGTTVEIPEAWYRLEVLA